MDELLLTESEKARIGGAFQREENKKLGLIRLIDMTAEAQLAHAKPIIEKAEREKVMSKDMIAWILKRLNSKDASEFMLAISVGKALKEAK